MVRTATSCSPETCSTARLVTSIVSKGHAVRRLLTSDAASRRCSKLSRMRSDRRSRRNAWIPSSTGCAPVSRTAKAWAMAEATCVGSWTGASATNQTPSGKSAAMSCATRMASRVLPTPPGPVSVTSRTVSPQKAVDGKRDLALPADEAGEWNRRRRANLIPIPERDEGRLLALASVGGRRVGHEQVLGWVRRRSVHHPPPRATRQRDPALDKTSRTHV